MSYALWDPRHRTYVAVHPRNMNKAHMSYRTWSQCRDAFYEMSERFRVNEDGELERLECGAWDVGVTYSQRPMQYYADVDQISEMARLCFHVDDYNTLGFEVNFIGASEIRIHS